MNNGMGQDWEDSFATFWMPDGEIRKIRKKYVLDFYSEALSDKEPKSKGAITVRDAVKTRGVGLLTELLGGCFTPLPTVAKEEPASSVRFEDHLANLHGIPASEKGE
jgi:hypothetical protein